MEETWQSPLNTSTEKTLPAHRYFIAMIRAELWGWRKGSLCFMNLSQREQMCWDQRALTSSAIPCVLWRLRCLLYATYLPAFPNKTEKYGHAFRLLWYIECIRPISLIFCKISASGQTDPLTFTMSHICIAKWNWCTHHWQTSARFMAFNTPTHRSRILLALKRIGAKNLGLAQERKNVVF